MPDMRPSIRQRARRADGIYEVTIGVVSERKLRTATIAAELVHETLRARLDDIFSRPGAHDAVALLADIATAIVDRLAAEQLLVSD